MSFDVYQTVTDKIVAALEHAGQWEKPWSSAFADGGAFARPRNAMTDKAYRGMNVPLLWSEKRASVHWATYKQWNELGAQVRKGEKGSTIIVWKEWTPKDGAPAGEDGDESGNGKRLFARAYWVFNAEQVEGWAAAPVPSAPTFDPVEAAESFVAATGVDLRHGGSRAYYNHGLDYVQMPDRGDFKGSSTCNAGEAYYGTLLHELVHWSGHAKRTAREFGKRFGDDAYAFEELVAELGAAFLSADLLLHHEPREDHAKYLKSWLSVLKGDKRAIFTAASKAEQAVTFLGKLQAPVKAAA